MTTTDERDLIAEWLEVRKTYVTISGAAERLGVKPSALEWAIKKGRRNGDDRIPTNIRKSKPSYSDTPHHTTTATVRRHPQQDAWAARVVAGRAHDALDAARLLAALGLDPSVGIRWGRRGKPNLMARIGRR